MKTILQVMDDRQFFAKTFKRGLLGRDSWKAWRSFLSALFGLPMNEEALEIFRKHTGRRTAPQNPFTECWVAAGRRSGKSQIAALTGTYVACFRDYSRYRAPNELLILPIIAPDRKQCQIILRYVNGLIDSCPMLQSMVKARLKESVELTNGVEIRVATASFRTLRGYTSVGAIIDEAAFLRSEESANPDTELIVALMPSLASIPGAPLLAISSPYARKGELWRAYKEHYGKDNSRVLVWQAETTAMNPSVNRAVIAAAYLRDRTSASAEYGAQFRSDIENFLPLEVIEKCVVTNRRELAPVPGMTYFGFCDPSGGRSDAMTLGISHVEKQKIVLDLLREVQPPFSPEATVAEFADTLRRYRVFSVTGDRYGAEWVVSAFEKCSIRYQPSDKTKSELYLEALPMLTSDGVELLDNARLVAQLSGLERRTTRGAKDSIDHGFGLHDDLANAACGSLCAAAASAMGILGEIEYLKQLSLNPSNFLLAPYNRPASAEEKAAMAMASGETHPCPDCKDGRLKRCNPRDPNMWECDHCSQRRQFSPGQAPQLGVSRGGYAQQQSEGHRGAGGQGFPRGLFGRFGS